MVAAWRAKVRAGLEESRRSWMAIPLVLLAWFTVMILDEPDFSEAWVAVTVWVVSLTVAGGLEISRRVDEGPGTRRLLDACTLLALAPFLAVAAVFAFASLVLPAERGISIDLQGDEQVTLFVAVMILPVLAPIAVASAVILRRRGSVLDLRVQLAAWIAILVAAMVVASFPGSVDIGPGGPLVLFLVVVYGPVVRRILWPVLDPPRLPVPTYRAV